MRVEVPIKPALAQELLVFWADTFGDIPDLDPGALLGEDAGNNDYYLYVTQRDGRVGGSCMTTHSLSVPSIGGFGEVATVPMAPAIVNAVNHALGTELTELPLTPERVVAGLVKQDGLAQA